GTAGSRHRATLSQPPSGKKISTYGSTPAARSSHWPTHRLGVANSVLGAGGANSELFQKGNGFRNFSSAAKRRKEFFAKSALLGTKVLHRAKSGAQSSVFGAKASIFVLLGGDRNREPIEIGHPIARHNGIFRKATILVKRAPFFGSD